MRPYCEDWLGVTCCRNETRPSPYELGPLISALAQCCRGKASARAVHRSAPGSRGQIVRGGRSRRREPRRQPTSLAVRLSPSQRAPTPAGSLADTPWALCRGIDENPPATLAC